MRENLYSKEFQLNILWIPTMFLLSTFQMIYPVKHSLIFLTIERDPL